jgi:hypothetical protein
VIAARAADERLARARLAEFADRLFAAAEALVLELRSGGLPIELRRGGGEGVQRLELGAPGLPERIVLLTHRMVAYVPELREAQGALYVFVVTAGSGVGVPVERFLVSASGALRCDGVCAPAEGNDTRALLMRLADAIWAQGRQLWAPFETVAPVTLAELDAPHLHGQLGFRPHAASADRLSPMNH